MKTVNVNTKAKNLTLGLAALVMTLVTTACGSSSNNNNSIPAGYGALGLSCAGCPAGAQTYLTSAVADNFTLVTGTTPNAQPVQLSLSFFGQTPLTLAPDGMPALYGQVATAGILQLGAANACGLPAGTYQATTVALGNDPADGLAWGPIYMQVQGTPVVIGIAGTFDGGGPLVTAAGQTVNYRWGGAIAYYSSSVSTVPCAPTQYVQ